MEKLHKDGEIEKDGHEIKFTKEETVNEGKYDGMLDVIEDLVSKASSFMDVGNQLKKHKVKYSFSTSMIKLTVSLPSATKRIFLRLRTTSVTSSTIPSILWNSC